MANDDVLAFLEENAESIDLFDDLSIERRFEGSKGVWALYSDVTQSFYSKKYATLVEALQAAKQEKMR